MKKYAVYMPDRSLDGTLFSEINYLVDLYSKLFIEELGLSGVSVREERGYYKTCNSEISAMNNSVLYFYSAEDVTTKFMMICKKIKAYLKQETLLVICEGVEMFC